MDQANQPARKKKSGNMCRSIPFPLERNDACVTFHDLYEECGCTFKSSGHFTSSRSPNPEHFCQFVQDYFEIHEGRCSRCLKTPLIKKESIVVATKKLGLKGLSKTLAREIRERKGKDEDARIQRLGVWRQKINEREGFLADFKSEAASVAAFGALIRETRAWEEDNAQFHPQDKVIVYDLNLWYNELLSQVYGKSAICGVCGGRGSPELKRLPCKHCIHEGECLNNWLISNTLDNLECPTCKHRISVKQVPSTPLTDAFLYKTSARPEFDDSEPPEPDQPETMSVRTRTISRLSRQSWLQSGGIAGPG